MPLTQRLLRPALITAGLLLIPFVAMRFTREVQWDLFDFAFAGVLLFGTGLAFELVAGRGGSTAYRVGVGMALAAALLLVWVNGAVGIIGSENNPANLLYGGVLLVALVGAAVSRLRARGLARTMLAAALAQFLVPLLALLIWRPALDWGVLGVLGANAIFVLLWVGAALLFQRASATGPTPARRLA
ncbi:hypothetical protein J7E24_15025 [Hymenobacter sp. ISL-91]|uniref:hypothetical protein n=1 Tax=Hymenobacter sp. ISL-91 TaxID=2819151 RepID=UPI001BE72C2B|nr:hypothetical protein [Hymenobacter sp. ISL-91]MBT2559101.1 hypothetical protein [Hymenobacter sp. ISL-91]